MFTSVPYGYFNGWWSLGAIDSAVTYGHADTEMASHD